MFQRYLFVFLRNPAWVVIGVLQPVLYLVLFAPLLKSLTETPGFPSGGAYNVFVPGLLIQLGLFGASGVGFGLIAELRAGVIERFRVTPVSRFALLLGRSLRDILTLVVQSLILCSSRSRSVSSRRSRACSSCSGWSPSSGSACRRSRTRPRSR